MHSAVFYATIIIFLVLKINPIQAYGQKFTTNKNNVYYIDTEQKYSWFEALIACIEMDMTLVTIDTSTKSQEINTLVKNNFGNVKLWIGGIMTQYPNRHFIWLDTGKPFSYTNWQGSNPDFYGHNEYCAHIGWGNDLQWNDIDCTNRQGFICEYSQNRQQNKQMEEELQKERVKQQELQQQLLQRDQKQQELQAQLQEKQTQQDKLQQEVESVKEAAEKENQRYQQMQRNLKQEVEEKQEKLKQEVRKFEQLDEDLKAATWNLQQLQQELQIQQNLKDLLQEELQNLKEQEQVPTNDMNTKYRDIILHFHQN